MGLCGTQGSFCFLFFVCLPQISCQLAACLRDAARGGRGERGGGGGEGDGGVQGESERGVGGEGFHRNGKDGDDDEHEPGMLGKNFSEVLYRVALHSIGIITWH